MAGNQRWQAIPTQLDVLQFEEFVLPHLSVGRRGPTPKLSLHKIFNYVLRLLYMGCQWKELPIEKDGEGRPEIHYTRIYRIWRRWDSRWLRRRHFYRLGVEASSGQPPGYFDRSRRWNDDGSQKGRRQHRLQRPQEGQRR